MTNFDAQCELENAISDKVVKHLKLDSLPYKYKNRIYKHPMCIGVSEFLNGLTLDSDINAALQRSAFEGLCKFTWHVGYWTRKEKKTIELNNPTWADVFKVANEAYIDGGCPDHCFFDSIEKDFHSGNYEIHFGS